MSSKTRPSFRSRPRAFLSPLSGKLGAASVVIRLKSKRDSLRWSEEIYQDLPFRGAPLCGSPLGDPRAADIPLPRSGLGVCAPVSLPLPDRIHVVAQRRHTRATSGVKSRSTPSMSNNIALQKTRVMMASYRSRATGPNAFSSSAQRQTVPRRLSFRRN